MAAFLNIFLVPFAWILASVVVIRRTLYHSTFIKRYSPPIQVIGVGNLRVGGTGKTPLIEYLGQHFTQQSRQVAVLSRGYKRKTQGYLKVKSTSLVSEVGDEAVQLFQKLNNLASIHVCENRVVGVKNILTHEPNISLILLDDAYQHLAIQPSFHILLTTFNQPFFDDNLLPLGRLREPQTAAKYADLIIVTKCPDDLKPDQVKSFNSKSKPYFEGPIIYSHIKYLTPIPFGDKRSIDVNIVLVTAIAESQPLIDHVKRHYDLKHHFDFPDHHNYSRAEVKEIAKYSVENNYSLLTTAKDIVKLQAFSELYSLALFVQPIEIEFLFGGEEILQKMIEADQMRFI